MCALGNAQASANNYLQHHGQCHYLLTYLTSLSTHFPSLLHLGILSYLLHTILNILNCRNPEVSQKSLQTSSLNPVENLVHLGKPTCRSYQPIRVGPMKSELTVSSPRVSYPKGLMDGNRQCCRTGEGRCHQFSKEKPSTVVREGFWLRNCRPVHHIITWARNHSA